MDCNYRADAITRVFIQPSAESAHERLYTPGLSRTIATSENGVSAPASS
jgi:hypothetical protein